MSMGFPLDFYQISMGSLWYFYIFLLDFYGISMIFLLDFYENSMVLITIGFLWNAIWDFHDVSMIVL